MKDIYHILKAQYQQPAAERDLHKPHTGYLIALLSSGFVIVKSPLA